jgi:hypothetical protein
MDSLQQYSLANGFWIQKNLGPSSIFGSAVITLLKCLPFFAHLRRLVFKFDNHTFTKVFLGSFIQECCLETQTIQLHSLMCLR